MSLLLIDFPGVGTVYKIVGEYLEIPQIFRENFMLF